MSKREEIVKSVYGENMMRSVSPIYDESYVMCWLYEAIGRAIDKYYARVDELKVQTNPNTATWTLHLWEKQYGVMSAEGTSDEDRRNGITNKISFQKPLTPVRIERYLEQITGCECEIVENIAPFTFGVYLKSSGEPIDYQRVYDEVKNLKQAHHAFEVGIGLRAIIQIGINARGYIYQLGPYCGTKPHINMLGRAWDIGVNVETGAKAHSYPVSYSGGETCGTKPSTNMLGSAHDRGLNVSASAAATTFRAPYCGIHQCGKGG